MKQRLALRVADALLLVEAPDGCPLEPLSARQQPFEVPWEAPATHRLSVRLSLEPPPPRATDTPLYDTGETWIAFRQDAGVRLEFRHRRPDPRALWTALVPDDLAEGVVVHCGAELLQGGQLASPLRYPLDQLLLARLLAGEGLVLHAAGVRRGPLGVALPGHSGAGKSTSMRLLRRTPDLERLSDDRVVLRRRAGGFCVHGSPWAGDEGIAVAGSASLVAVGFLTKALRDELSPLPATAALGRLLPTASVLGWDGDLSAPAFGVCRAVTAALPCFELRFRREGDVARLVRELLETQSPGPATTTTG